MRIGIDARKLYDYGIGTYIRNLVKQLARLDRETEFVLLCRPQDAPGLSALGENFRPVTETAGLYSVAEQIKIPWDLKREKVSLFHAPHYVLPPLVPCRSVVTIHDCIHLMFPEYLPNQFALRYARSSIRMAARRADRVLTVSESSKRDILKFVDTDPDKIHVIYNAHDERFSHEPREEDVVRVRERYQLQDEFVLYAGNVKPHKNVERLIDAFQLVHARGLDHLKLVIIGDELSKSTAVRRAVHRHNLHKFVRFLGYLPEDTLAVMYRLAGLFVFPSLYEGFGLPPLEAMASGTPVVTSNVSSLPEVAGDAAVLVNPLDAGDIADGIMRVLTDETVRRDLRRKGLARARQFSWETSARRVREIYAQVGATMPSAAPPPVVADAGGAPHPVGGGKTPTE
ncbi:MAG: glycosyltransferase family 4 protein [Vicinamibacterales bacterium]